MTGPPNQVGAGGVAAPPEPNASLASDDETVPNGVWCHAVGVVLAHRPPGLSDGDWLLSIQLAWFADPDGTNIHPQLRTLAERLGKSPSSIGEGMRRLVARAVIVRTAGGPRKKSTYALAVGPWRHRADPESARAARAAVEQRSARAARASLRGPSARAARADLRGLARADLPSPSPLLDPVVELEVSREAQPVDILGRSDPVPFEQTATNLTGITLAKLRLHPDAVAALIEAIGLTLTAGAAALDDEEIPGHLSWTTNKAGPADRRRRRKVSA